MKTNKPVRAILATLAFSALFYSVPGCSNAGVAGRQETISGSHNKMLDNRATRIEARNARWDASREVWMN